MKANSPNKKTLKTVENLIEEAVNAELRRDIPALQDILQDVWDIDEETPGFDDFEPFARAELLRLCGFFITFNVACREDERRQITAKNLLTQSARLFEELNLPDKAAESNILLGFAFWNSGEIDEAEAILRSVEADFSENQKHPVYIQLLLNRLMIASWQNDFSSALRLIEKVSGLIEDYANFRLKITFHTEAGITFEDYAVAENRKEFFEQAEYHYSEVHKLSKKHGDRHHEAHNYNNLANLYLKQEIFRKAYVAVNQAISFGKLLEQPACIAHFQDTRANIQFAQGYFDEALQTINDALEVSGQGENYLRFTEHLWTKCRCLLALENYEEAFICYGEIQKIAGEKIGEKIVKKYARLLANQTYMIHGFALGIEVDNFEKTVLKRALIKTGGKIGKAALLLGEDHQGVSWKMNHKYPELYEELTIPKRVRMKKCKTAKDDGVPPGHKLVTLKAPEIKDRMKISKLVLPSMTYSFNFNLPGESVEVFYFDSNVMMSFGISIGAVVAVCPVDKLIPGRMVLVCENNHYSTGKIEIDAELEIAYIANDGQWIPLDGTNVVGEPVGYSRMPENHQTIIEFELLNSDLS